ncbi:MAG: adenylate/guanylate cyclase domain-containing protein [Calditrichia bacterium]
MKLSPLKKLVTGVLVGLASGVLIWLLSQFILKPFFFRLEAQTYDWRLKRVIEEPQNPIEDVVIVDVDERSVKKLGSYHQWPRTYWERLIRNLDSAGVKIIGTDFIFDPDLRHPEEDQAFRQAIKESGIVCSALYFVQADSEHFQYAMSSEPAGLEYQRFLATIPPNLFPHLIRQDRLEPEDPRFLNASATAGFVNLFPDPDGILRRIPLFLRFNDHAYPAFAFQIASKVLEVERYDYLEGRNVLLLQREGKTLAEVPIDDYGQMVIHYVGGFRSFRYVSFYDALMNFLPAEFWKGKIVLVGSSLTGLYDLRAIPLQAIYPGVEVNANVVYQLLNQKFIYQLSHTAFFIFIISMGLLVGILLMFPRPLGSIVLAIILILLVILGGILALDIYSYWMPIATPVFTILVAFAGTYIYRYVFEERDKRRIRKTFSHYVSPAVVDEVLKHPEKLKLGGERKTCSVLFSDVAGFTTLSEQLEPEVLVNLLNEYLTQMTNLVFENQGMLDKYEGDAIMAVFGAPIELPNHAELACRTALQMQQKLKELREKWKQEGKPELHARVGINSGVMVVGNMGSQTRFDYTVMGDSVNLASRLEGANKLYDTSIMIGENTYELVKDFYITRPLDLLRVKGKKKPVKVYELIAEKATTLKPEFMEMLLQYQKGFDNYLMRNWEWAINHFRQALQIKSDDGPSRLYLLRCQEFLNNPPGEDWDGVFVMKTK